MKLFFFQPTGHGQYSAFVCAESANDAAIKVNEFRANRIKDNPSSIYEYGDREFVASDFSEADPGIVIWNEND